MPPHNSFRSDQRNSPDGSGKPPIQLDEEQAVAVRKVDATAHLASQYNQLMPESSRRSFDFWREKTRRKYAAPGFVTDGRQDAIARCVRELLAG